MALMFRTYYTDLCRRVVRILNDPDLAEDIAQDVFLTLWKKRDRLRIDSSLSAYLGRAARNRALNHLRDNPMDQKREELTDEQWLVEATAIQQLHADDLQARVDVLLDSLPERCRLVFVLSRFEELSNKEIARTMEISEKTVENQMNKALRLLRKGLEPFL